MTPPTSEVEEPAVEDEEAEPASSRRWLLLGGVALAALAIRLVMVFVVHPLCDFDADRWADPAQYQTTELGTGSCMSLTGDSVYVSLQGRMLEHGDGLSDPVTYFTSGTSTPSGKKPPGVALLVAGLARIGLGSPDATRVVLAMLGSLAVAVLGLVAWDLGGRRAGLLTAGLAAVSPVLITNDWRMLTEPMVTLAFAGVLLFAYRLWARPSVANAVLMGVCIGAGTYARFESLALLLAVGAPLLFGLRWLRFGNRFQLALVVALAAFTVAMPQILFNVARFNNLAPFGPGSGWGMKNATCDDAWYGEYTGYLAFSCFDVATVAEATAVSSRTTPPPPDESDTDLVYRRRAFTYLEQNAARLPAVAAARVGRVLGLYRPAQTVTLDGSVEQRGEVDAWASLLAFALALPFAVVGAVVLWHRRIPLSPIIGAGLLVVVLVAASFGLPRYRIYLDVAALLAAGVGIDALVRRLRSRRPGAPWWAPGSGADAPAPAVLAGTARATWPRRVPGRPVWIGAAVLVVAAAGVTAWSATLEPASSAGPASADAVVLCDDLKAFEQLVGQVSSRPEVLGKVLPTVDRLLKVAPPELVQPLSTIRVEVAGYLDAGSDPTYYASIGPERQQRLLKAVQRVAESRAELC